MAVSAQADRPNPQAFLNEVVLQSFQARLWLSSRLAVARKLRVLCKLTLQAPRIWLLTRLYKVTDAQSLVVLGRKDVQGATGAVPLEPTGVAQLLGVNAGVRLRTESGSVVQLGAQILGERVWAAQY